MKFTAEMKKELWNILIGLSGSATVSPLFAAAHSLYGGRFGVFTTETAASTTQTGSSSVVSTASGITTNSMTTKYANTAKVIDGGKIKLYFSITAPATGTLPAGPCNYFNLYNNASVASILYGTVSCEADNLVTDMYTTSSSLTFSYGETKEFYTTLKFKTSNLDNSVHFSVPLVEKWLETMLFMSYCVGFTRTDSVTTTLEVYSGTVPTYAAIALPGDAVKMATWPTWAWTQIYQFPERLTITGGTAPTALASGDITWGRIIRNNVQVISFTVGSATGNNGATMQLAKTNYTAGETIIFESFKLDMIME